MLFLRSHACTAKVFIVVKYVHHGRWPSRTSNPRNQLPAQCPGHSVRQALFVKLGSRTNSLSYDLGLVASCHSGPGSEMFYFLKFKKLKIKKNIIIASAILFSSFKLTPYPRPPYLYYKFHCFVFLILLQSIASTQE